MSGLETVCACGHKACFHPSAAQQAVQIAKTNGRYSGECKGGPSSLHCRCITSREEVMHTPETKEPTR